MSGKNATVTKRHATKIRREGAHRKNATDAPCRTNDSDCPIALSSRNIPKSLNAVWLACYYARRLAKNDVISADIRAAAEMVVEYTMNSDVSLRVTGGLLVGVTHLYGRKVNYFLLECRNALMRMQKAAANLSAQRRVNKTRQRSATEKDAADATSLDGSLQQLCADVGLDSAEMEAEYLREKENDALLLAQLLKPFSKGNDAAKGGIFSELLLLESLNDGSEENSGQRYKSRRNRPFILSDVRRDLRSDETDENILIGSIPSLSSRAVDDVPMLLSSGPEFEKYDRSLLDCGSDDSSVPTPKFNDSGGFQQDGRHDGRHDDQHDNEDTPFVNEDDLLRDIGIVIEDQETNYNSSASSRLTPSVMQNDATSDFMDENFEPPPVEVLRRDESERDASEEGGAFAREHRSKLLLGQVQKEWLDDAQGSVTDVPGPTELAASNTGSGRRQSFAPDSTDSIARTLSPTADLLRPSLAGTTDSHVSRMSWITDDMAPTTDELRRSGAEDHITSEKLSSSIRTPNMNDGSLVAQGEDTASRTAECSEMTGDTTFENTVYPQEYIPDEDAENYDSMFHTPERNSKEVRNPKKIIELSESTADGATLSTETDEFISIVPNDKITDERRILSPLIENDVLSADGDAGDYDDDGEGEENDEDSWDSLLALLKSQPHRIRRSSNLTKTLQMLGADRETELSHETLAKWSTNDSRADLERCPDAVLDDLNIPFFTAPGLLPSDGAWLTRAQRLAAVSEVIEGLRKQRSGTTTSDAGDGHPKPTKRRRLAGGRKGSRQEDQLSLASIAKGDSITDVDCVASAGASTDEDLLSVESAENTAESPLAWKLAYDAIDIVRGKPLNDPESNSLSDEVRQQLSYGNRDYLGSTTVYGPMHTWLRHRHWRKTAENIVMLARDRERAERTSQLYRRQAAVEASEYAHARRLETRAARRRTAPVASKSKHDMTCSAVPEEEEEAEHEMTADIDPQGGGNTVIVGAQSLTELKGTQQSNIEHEQSARTAPYEPQTEDSQCDDLSEIHDFAIGGDDASSFENEEIASEHSVGAHVIGAKRNTSQPLLDDPPPLPIPDASTPATSINSFGTNIGASAANSVSRVLASAEIEQAPVEICVYASSSSRPPSSSGRRGLLSAVITPTRSMLCSNRDGADVQTPSDDRPKSDGTITFRSAAALEIFEAIHGKSVRAYPGRQLTPSPPVRSTAISLMRNTRDSVDSGHSLLDDDEIPVVSHTPRRIVDGIEVTDATTPLRQRTSTWFSPKLKNVAGVAARTTRVLRCLRQRVETSHLKAPRNTVFRSPSSGSGGFLRCPVPNGAERSSAGVAWIESLRGNKNIVHSSTSSNSCMRDGFSKDVGEQEVPVLSFREIVEGQRKDIVAALFFEVLTLRTRQLLEIAPLVVESDRLVQEQPLSSRTPARTTGNTIPSDLPIALPTLDILLTTAVEESSSEIEVA